MLKLIGAIAVFYFMFYWGIAQLIAVWGIVALSYIASI